MVARELLINYNYSCPPAKEGGERSERVVVFGLRTSL